jgi:hypothetical protein
MEVSLRFASGIIALFIFHEYGGWSRASYDVAVQQVKIKYSTESYIATNWTNI